MAANSNNPYDVLLWIQKVLDSCTIDEERFAVNKLLFLFEKKYNPTVCSTMWNQYMYIWNQI